jgi:hypothetical protein
MSGNSKQKKAPKSRQNLKGKTPTALAVPKRAIVDVDNARFAEVIALIEAARARGYQAVNTVLVEHYW